MALGATEDREPWVDPGMVQQFLSSFSFTISGLENEDRNHGASHCAVFQPLGSHSFRAVSSSAAGFLPFSSKALPYQNEN